MTARRKAQQMGNVVRLPTRPSGADAIMANVLGEAQAQSSRMSERLQAMVDAVEARHRERAQGLVQIGVQMDGPTLASFLEIGRRLLAQGRRI